MKKIIEITKKHTICYHGSYCSIACEFRDTVIDECDLFHTRIATIYIRKLYRHLRCPECLEKTGDA